MGIKGKRVAFTFDDSSLRTLEQMKADGDDLRLPCPCCGQTKQSRALTQITLRDPDGTERVVVIPPLLSL